METEKRTAERRRMERCVPRGTQRQQQGLHGETGMCAGVELLKISPKTMVGAEGRGAEGEGEGMTEDKKEGRRTRKVWEG